MRPDVAGIVPDARGCVRGVRVGVWKCPGSARDVRDRGRVAKSSRQELRESSAMHREGAAMSREVAVMNAYGLAMDRERVATDAFTSVMKPITPAMDVALQFLTQVPHY